MGKADCCRAVKRAFWKPWRRPANKSRRHFPQDSVPCLEKNAGDLHRKRKPATSAMPAAKRLSFRWISRREKPRNTSKIAPSAAGQISFTSKSPTAKSESGRNVSRCGATFGLRSNLRRSTDRVDFQPELDGSSRRFHK